MNAVTANKVSPATSAPASPVQASTPEPTSAPSNADPVVVIMTKLDEVQDLCSSTMAEVQGLKAKWSTHKEEAKKMKVSPCLAVAS